MTLFNLSNAKKTAIVTNIKLFAHDGSKWPMNKKQKMISIIAMNPRLRLAVEQAKKASMPRDTLERAIKKGAGLLDGGVNFEKVTYEGFAPHRVPIIVECLTDNVNRTISSMRVLFRKGQLGASGSVAWDFDHLGMIEASPAKADADAELAAIEAGADDFEVDEDGEV